ncbi:HISTONE H1-3 family protein [Salix suchowensis]|nr:HISTONE H1-3 family protein [Salix suchowensis]
MTTGEEAEAPVAEQPLATEEPKVEEKPVKEKKPRTPREKKPRQPKPKTVAHPPYFQPICNSQVHGREAQGSTPCKFKKILVIKLKNSAARGKLIKIRASFKLSEAGKKEKRLQGKSPMEGLMPAQRKLGEEGQEISCAKPKQPKSIKSPSVKRAKKVTATA